MKITRLKRIFAFVLFLTISPLSSPPAATPGSPRLQWSQHFFKWRIGGRNETARPAISEHLVLIGTEAGKMYALKRTNGRVVWKYNAHAALSSQPGMSEDKAFFGDAEGRLHAVRLENGVLVWKEQMESRVRGAPVYHKGLLFVQTLGDEVLALDAETGKEIWKFKAPPLGPLALLHEARPLFENDVLYAAFASGVVFAAEAADGRILWQRNLSGAELAFSAASSPFTAEKNLVTAALGKGLFALGPRDGVSIWRLEEAEAFSAVSNAAREHVFLSTLTGSLYALETRNGKTIWRGKVPSKPEASFSGIESLGNLIFIGDSKNTLWAYNQEQGNQVWKFNPWNDAGGFANTPTVREANLAAWSTHGTLYYFELP